MIPELNPDKISREDADYKGSYYFPKYGRKIFPYLYECLYVEYRTKNSWLWLFDSEWSDIQSTIKDAIWRIDKLLEHGFDFFENEQNWTYHTRDKCIIKRKNITNKNRITKLERRKK